MANVVRIDMRATLDPEAGKAAIALALRQLEEYSNCLDRLNRGIQDSLKSLAELPSTALAAVARISELSSKASLTAAAAAIDFRPPELSSFPAFRRLLEHQRMCVEQIRLTGMAERENARLRSEALVSASPDTFDEASDEVGAGDWDDVDGSGFVS